MKHILRLLSLASALSFGALAQAEIQLLDRIIAIVDDSTVTQSELDRRIADIIRRTKEAGVRLPAMSILREQVLDQIISEKLQLNTASLREQIREQLALQSVSQGVISSRVKISEADIENFLKSADAQFWISPEYHLQHILIPLGSEGGSQGAASAQNKAESVHQKLLNGANFSEMAIAESKGPAALKGGDLGFRKSSQLPTLFAEIVANLEVGDIAKPARSQAGFHILKLVEKRGETKSVVRQNKVRHILIKTNEILNREQALEKIDGIRQQIIDGGDFVELAKEHSDDIGSRMSGGDLGWSRPGQFVPAFEEAMETAEVGEISKPFLSQFGWHVLQVVDRRDEDFSEEMIRARARNLLVGRRFEDEMQVWLQEMRDDAYIEIKI